MLNFSQEKLKVIHPVLKEWVELPKYEIVSDAMVADLMGGEAIPSIPGATVNRLTMIGEMLVVDSRGNLHVHNEAQDIENVRRYTVPKEEKPKKDAETDPAGIGGSATGEGQPVRRGRRGSDS